MLRSFFCKDFLLNKPAKNEDDEQSKKKKKVLQSWYKQKQTIKLLLFSQHS